MYTHFSQVQSISAPLPKTGLSHPADLTARPWNLWAMANAARGGLRSGRFLFRSAVRDTKPTWGRVQTLAFGFEASCCDCGEVVSEYFGLTHRGEVDNVFGCIERVD